MIFKTGGWQAFLSPVGSTPTRFRHLFSCIYIETVLVSISLRQQLLYGAQKRLGYLQAVGDGLGFEVLPHHSAVVSRALSYTLKGNRSGLDADHSRGHCSMG